MALRVNVSFEESILKKVDEEAKRMGLSRSAFITVAVNQYFMQIENVNAVSTLKEMIDKVELLNQINIDDLSWFALFRLVDFNFWF